MHDLLMPDSREGADNNNEASRLEVRFFGGFSLRVHGEEKARSLPRRGKSLLVLLMLRRQTAWTREGLATILWPDAPQERAAFYLRRALGEVRNALGEEQHRILSLTRTMLSLDLTDAFCDVREFDRLTTEGTEEAALRAAALYQGDFWEECDAPWVIPEREQRRESFTQVLELLAGREERRGNFAEAARILRRLVNADPLRESAQRRLMQVLGQAGDYAGVERQYRNLRQALRNELNMEPAAETFAQYQVLRAQATRIPLDSTLRPKPSMLSAFYNLPCPLTALVGREGDVKKIATALQSARLVTLLGPGGVGKTRLALRVAETEMKNYSAGVCFADLTAAQTAEELSQTLAASLDLSPPGDTTLLEALRRFLRPRALLLLLDNAEHIADACAALTDDLLRHCPELTILCTSRQPLYVVGEAVIPVTQLAVWEGDPDQEEAASADIMRCASVCLLMDRIQSAAPAFRLDPTDVSAIASICRSLDGLPLALELVAIQFRGLSPREIAARLDIRFRLLDKGSPAQPRHRTLHAALDWSYELLSEAERTLLGHLSVFRGGWTLEAAEGVCLIPEADTGALLTALVEKSLVVYEPRDRDGQGRYRLLEMTRQYAEEHLDDTERFDLQQCHATFFYRMAQAADAAAKVRYWPVKTDALWQERDNFRAAHTLLHQRDTDEALWLEFFLYLTTIWPVENVPAWIARQEQATIPLTLLGLRVAYCVSMWALWGKHPATEPLLHALLEAARCCSEPIYQIRCLDLLSILEAERGNVCKSGEYMEEAVQIDAPNIDACTLSRVTAKSAVNRGRRGDLESAVKLLEAQIQSEKHRGEWEALCITFFHLGELLLEYEKYERAQYYLNEGVLLSEQWQPLLLPYFWQKLGDAAFKQGDFARAKACLNHGLMASRRNGTPDRQGWSQWDLARVSFQEGAREDAEAHLREGIRIFQAIHEPHSVTRFLVKLAEYCIAWEQHPRAAILLGSVDRAREEYHFRDTANAQILTERLAATLRQSFGAAMYEENWQWGRQMTLTQTVDFILKSPKPPKIGC